jgi:hypothetical protein
MSIGEGGGRHRLAKTLLIGGVLAAGAVAVPAAYAATTPPPVGFVKICKVGASTAVTGSFSFTVTGMKDPVVVPVGGCSKPLPTTLRRVTVTEAARTGFVAAKITTKPDGRLVSSSVAKAAAEVKVPAGNTTSATVVTFTNKVAPPPPPPPPATLRVCKVAGPGVAVGQAFSFTVGTATVSVKAGSCSAPLTIAVSPVTVKEAATAGLAVKAIAVTGVGSLTSSDLATGTASVKVASGATAVTYTNVKPGVTGCVRGDGYYQTHADVVAKLVAKNGGTLSIGGVPLTAAQISALYQRNSDNYLDQLTQKLLTARLNQISGASTPTDVQKAIDAAQALETAAGGPLKGKATPQTTVKVAGVTYTASQLVGVLSSYNAGTSGGPTACA